MKGKDYGVLFLMLGIGLPLVIFYTFHFFFLYQGKSLIGQNICFIICAIFVWGIFDLLYHFKQIIWEDNLLEEFQASFSTTTPQELSQRFQHSIIGKRFTIISNLHASLSEISHEILTEIISASESRRAIFAKYFLGTCVLLGLLGTFLGLLETIGGAYLAVETIGQTGQLAKSLHQPLSGMSLAFGTSVLGIVSSLALGISYLFFYRRQLIFLSALEEFTQATLIPSLTKSTGKMMEEMSYELKAIRAGLDHFSKWGSELQNGMEKSAFLFFEQTSSVVKSLAEQVNQKMRQVLDETPLLIQSAVKQMGQRVQEEHNDFLRQWTNFLDQEMGTFHKIGLTLQNSQEKLQTNYGQLSHQLAEHSQHLTELVSREEKSREITLTRMSEVLLLEEKIRENTLARVSEVLIQEEKSRENTLTRIFEVLLLEEKNREITLAKVSEVSMLFKEVSNLIQKNQVEMQACLAMFVQGIDKLLGQSSQNDGQAEEEQDFLKKLEASLALFHERAGGVLVEYAARSREVLAGILENQSWLVKEIQKIK